ncbi:uncharacterized protein PHA67_022072 [Liasis olivaceus]
MPLCYFLVVPILFLLESARITGEATTEPTLSPPTSVPTSEPRPSPSVAETIGGTAARRGRTPATAMETTGSLPFSPALLPEATSQVSALGEKGLPGEGATLLSSSSPEGTAPTGTLTAGTQNASAAFSPLGTTTIASPASGGSLEGGRTPPAESTVALSSSTVDERSSGPRSPTPEGKLAYEGLLTTPITSRAATTASERASSPPAGARTMETFPSSVPLLTATFATSAPASAIAGLGDPTGISEGTTSSDAEVSSWRLEGTLPSSSPSLAQGRTGPKATSGGLVSPSPEGSSVGLAAPSSTSATTESPPTTWFTLKALSSTILPPSPSKGLPKTPVRTRFILSMGLNTSLNITDPSISSVVLKWLGQELQANFPVGSFNLTWIG